MADGKGKDKYAVIRQGDQYLIPVILKLNEEILTPDMADGVKISFDKAVCSYPNGGLTYSDGYWLYPLTQKLSLSMEEGYVDFQAQIKIGSDVHTLPKQKVIVDESDIREVW